MSGPAYGKKRIAINSIMLYIRMFFVLGITLFTTRELLSIVGVDDYGAINLIGGIVILFSFLNNALISSTQRFLNYYLGKGDEYKLRNVFKASLHCHFLIAIVVLFLAETIGLWFLHNKLSFPQKDTVGIDILYQFTILSMLVSIIRVPYSATIIAYEKMGIFAVLSTLEAVLKLLSIYLLIFAVDKLSLYGVYTFIISCLITLSYYIFTRRHYPITEVKSFFKTNQKQLKSQLFFSGWYLLGGGANIGATQGMSFILNIYYGIIFNAALGIATQVRSGVYNFVSSFQTAFNPQLVKLYASNEREKLNDLVVFSSKVSFCLLLIVCLPIILFCEEILKLWLNNIPPYSVIFTQMILIMNFFDALSSPLWTVIGATGKVKKYQIFVSLIVISSLPMMILLMKSHPRPELLVGCSLLSFMLAYFYRIYYYIKHTGFRLSDYFKKVLTPIFMITVLSYVLCCYIIDNIFVHTNWILILFIDIISITILSVIILFDKKYFQIYLNIIKRN